MIELLGIEAVLKRVGSLFGGAWDWATASAAHLFATALALSLMANGWQLYDVRRERAAAAKRESVLLAAFTQEKAAYRSVRQALDRQNKAIDVLAADGRARQLAAQQHERAAQARSKDRAAASSAIGRELAKLPPASADCRTPASVLAAKALL